MNEPTGGKAADQRPWQYLWVWDPETQAVHLEADHLGETEVKMHHLMAEHVRDPDRIDGYAIAIKDGWRIIRDDLLRSIRTLRHRS